MSAENRCRGCGGVLMAEDLGQLCPVCLLRSGQAESDTGPFMSGTSRAPASWPRWTGRSAVCRASCCAIPS